MPRDHARPIRIAARRLASIGLALLLGILFQTPAYACDTPVSVCAQSRPGSFALIRKGHPAAILIEQTADPAIHHVGDSFAADLERVSGRSPRRFATSSSATGDLIVIGMLGHSDAIDTLVRTGKIMVSDLPGQWEAFRQIVVENPFPNVPRALVIVGADRRGAVFGTYDISEKIGVSPWYWFADVPVAHRANLFVTAGSRRDQPGVRYRGFFINDEDPAFSGWARKKFGGVNAAAYAHVFELDLRLKGNYIWPAMWAPKAFALDDPANRALADDMGIVMGTSHHEPMTRAQAEWHRMPEDPTTGGRWDYTANAENLRTFWRGGIARMASKPGGGTYENLVTIGMRGDGDEPMSEGTATELLEKIVADQRAIITEMTGKPAAQTPQVWALYKEVQDYYDHGMRVPDDVTLLFADDNWGQIRRLPDPDARPRAGGYGVYYHFDYVGAPRNYKWINTSQIGKIWQQMDLAWQSGARNLWIVNVGDIKPMEYPLDFFMKMAWNPEAMTVQGMAAFPRAWAERTFGPANAREIAEVVTEYSRLAARRKPELLDQNSFALGPVDKDALDGGEFGRIVADWRDLARRAAALRARIPADQHDAYEQLIGYPVDAFANLYELLYAAAWNRLLAARNDARANVFADRVEAAFARDANLTAGYHALGGGKWDGMMTQVHMSYVSWNDPAAQTMPGITRVTPDTPPGKRRAVKFRDVTGGTKGPILINAARYNRAFAQDGLAWTRIPHLGRHGAIAVLPQARAPSEPGHGPRVDYDWTLARPGKVRIALRLSPTLDTRGTNGVRVGVSIDGGAITTLVSRLTPAPNAAVSPEQKAWVAAVVGNEHALQLDTQLPAGRHTLQIWRIDDNLVLEAIAVEPVE